MMMWTNTTHETGDRISMIALVRKILERHVREEGFDRWDDWHNVELQTVKNILYKGTTPSRKTVYMLACTLWYHEETTTQFQQLVSHPWYVNNILKKAYEMSNMKKIWEAFLYIPGYGEIDCTTQRAASCSLSSLGHTSL